MIPSLDPRTPTVLTPGLAALLTAAAALLQVTFVLMLLVMGMDSGPPTQGIAKIMGFGLAFMLAASRIPAPPAFHLGFVRPPAVAWWAGVFLLASILLVSELDNVSKQVWPVPEELLARAVPEGAGYSLGLLFYLVIVLPLSHEVFFRGLLQPRMVEHWGTRRGVLCTALLDAGASLLLNPWAVVSALCSALLIGTLRHASGSLLPGLALHALFGACGFLASYGAFGIPGFDDTTAPHTPLGWLAPAAALTGVGLGLCRVAASAPRPQAPPDVGDTEPD